MSGYCQGIFTPKNPSKYNGKYPIVYRSAPEKRLFAFADNSRKVIKWSSESVIVPYIKPTDGRIHRYFVDMTFDLQLDNGTIQKYLVEYKPIRQTQPPKPSKRKKESVYMKEQIMYATNISKWEAAKAYADKNNMKFMILTEKDLGI